MNKRRGAALAANDRKVPSPDNASGYRVERKTPRLAYGVVHTHVVYDSRLSFAARTLYSILCAHATTGDRSAWPGTARLAELMGCSDRTRWAAQQELIKHGYLKITRLTDRGLWRGNLYTLTDDLPPESVPQQRPEADDGSLRPEADCGSGDTGEQRPEADYGYDLKQTAGHSDPQQIAGHEQPNRENKGAAGRVAPLRELYHQRLKGNL